MTMSLAGVDYGKRILVISCAFNCECFPFILVTLPYIAVTCRVADRSTSSDY